MKKSNVYTRTGDAGTTSLAGGTRVPKTHIRLEAYGTVDELSSHLGLLAALLTEDADRNELITIQNNLFVVGASLASDTTVSKPGPAATLTADAVEKLERAIDVADEPLPPWRGFTLPGGTQAAAQCHVCRTVCRRAERRILALAAEVPVDAVLQVYMNRLSDYLYVLARKINFMSGTDENLWQKP